jgi:hypothetical protein
MDTNIPAELLDYVRVSSDQQAQQGTIESQLAAVQRFATEQGLKVERVG